MMPTAGWGGFRTLGAQAQIRLRVKLVGEAPVCRARPQRTRAGMMPTRRCAADLHVYVSHSRRGAPCASVEGNARELDPKRQCRPASWRALTRSHHQHSATHAMSVCPCAWCLSHPPTQVSRKGFTVQLDRPLDGGRGRHQPIVQVSTSSASVCSNDVCFRCGLQPLEPPMEASSCEWALQSLGSPQKGLSLFVRDAGSEC